MTQNKLSSENSLLFAGNAAFLEKIVAQYSQDPNSVTAEWQQFCVDYIQDTSAIIQDNVAKLTKNTVQQHQSTTQETTLSQTNPNGIVAKILRLIEAYRGRGHNFVTLDPLAIEQLPTKQQFKLDFDSFAITAAELAEPIKLSGTDFYGEACSSGQAIVDHLARTYSSDIGLQAAHMDDMQQQQWLYQKLESTNNELSTSKQQQILQDLIEIEGFEQYLHVKFAGAKRFSVEGGDSSIVALNTVIEDAAISGVENVVIGMAHRGRLNTLTKVLGKSYKAIFSEFKGLANFTEDLQISGDVKYHMGYSNVKLTNDNRQINVSLMPNPSHLEAVNPLVMGKVRAKQDGYVEIDDAGKRHKTLAILVHGDAAFAGQGIVFETLMMSELQPYNVGGVIHIVINNQVGFTANAADTHSGRYTTDVAKTIGIPIFHVCGDNPAAVVRATNIALEFRNKFARDVVIDIVCYRKYGHNEGDEPMFTQSMMYNIIKEKLTPGKIYAQQLEAKGLLKTGKFEELKENFRAKLDQEFEAAKTYKPQLDFLKGKWQHIVRARNAKKLDIATGVEVATLNFLGNKLCTIPLKFNLNAKIDKLLKDRKQMFSNNKPIDWATAEQLAYASLLVEGYNIRLTGQDAGRGTFSHRHSVLHDQINGKKYSPLNNLQEKQAYYEVADSNLSEYGVLGFEYGYASEDPNNLVLWEAQFGDFANGAQIIFDQFIAAAEAKWLRMNGLVCLLPHGYEGQGPEHSSARIERFLQLAADNNIQVVNPSCPASFFHLLRRQMLRDFRNPLIIMTPKSLLRHKLAVSKLEDIDVDTKFKPVIDDSLPNTANITKVILCSGKIYYDLLEQREQNKITTIAIVRLEQYYPFPAAELAQILRKYSAIQQVSWVQEEPENMGAWRFVGTYINNILRNQNNDLTLEYVGRPDSASTAVGYLNIHQIEQTKIIKVALNLGAAT